jgi:hypothetical protein
MLPLNPMALIEAYRLHRNPGVRRARAVGALAAAVKIDGKDVAQGQEKSASQNRADDPAANNDKAAALGLQPKHTRLSQQIIEYFLYQGKDLYQAIIMTEKIMKNNNMVSKLRLKQQQDGSPNLAPDTPIGAVVRVISADGRALKHMNIQTPNIDILS